MSDFSKLKEYLENTLSEYPLISGDILVMKDHKPVFRAMCGYKDVKKTQKIKGDEWYYLFSCTKMCTCISIMQLIEQGKVSLSGRLCDYIPEYKDMYVKGENGEKVPAKNHITIKQLMSMTAGFNYNLEADAIKRMQKEPDATTLDYIKALASEPLDFEPGTKWQYSLCHDVLAGVVEAVSGMTFYEYLKKNIFEPLGIKNTKFSPEPSEKERFVDMVIAEVDGNFSKVDWELIPYQFSRKYESGGAGLISSTEEYVLIADALANDGVGKTGNRILTSESIDLLRKDVLQDDMRPAFFRTELGYGYGLGFRTLITQEKGAKSPVGEFGWDGAQGAYYVVDPENHIAIMYTTQIASEHGFMYDIVHPKLRDLVYEGLGL